MEKYISACTFDSEMCLYKKTYLHHCTRKTPPKVGVLSDNFITQAEGCLRLKKCEGVKKPEVWSPSITADKIINQFIYLDQFIANSIKTEVVCRNYTSVPNGLFYIIFSYLHNDFF